MTPSPSARRYVCETHSERTEGLTTLCPQVYRMLSRLRLVQVNRPGFRRASRLP
jgi:hypothetical protein